ncbi:hypothetical protein CASFOL_040083 [Castilleja foliolosa]|uniref:Uncharacterized protein n=1 Tax=Castilleja foliolosa TaxID=1961234 RepID=A0ABD3BEU3_9LAMI
MDSRFDCFQNSRCSWCRSDALDDHFFPKWKLQYCLPRETVDLLESMGMKYLLGAVLREEQGPISVVPPMNYGRGGGTRQRLVDGRLKVSGAAGLAGNSEMVTRRVSDSRWSHGGAKMSVDDEAMDLNKESMSKLLELDDVDVVSVANNFALKGPAQIMGCFACFDGGNKQWRREELRLASEQARAKAAEAAQKRCCNDDVGDADCGLFVMRHMLEIIKLDVCNSFEKGDVLGSVVEFDKAIEFDPRQRACKFEEGAEQFRLDVAQNPNDTEESIWCFLCEAQLFGVDEARGRFLEVGTDRRPVMREAYRMFRDGGDPEKLVAAFSDGRESEYFYASLYAGLYYESQKKSGEAKLHLVAACKSPYGSSLMTTWHRLPRFIVIAETGCSVEKSTSPFVFSIPRQNISRPVLSMEEPYSSDDIDDVRKRWAEYFLEVI